MQAPGSDGPHVIEAGWSSGGAGGWGEFGVEGARYRVQARALYAILRGVIEMYPVTASAVQRRTRAVRVRLCAYAYMWVCAGGYVWVCMGMFVYVCLCMYMYGA